MIRLVRNCSVILLFIFSNHPMAQQSTSQSLAQNIISSYNSFNYPETDRLISIALNQIEKFSASDQIQIYQYAAFRKFQHSEPFVAREYFWKLLDIDPSYSLDPVTTSPKILALFQKTKVEYLENLKQRFQKMQKDFTYKPMPWRSLLFPGWEQLHRGYRFKGTLWVAAGSGCLIGLVQSIIRTEKKNDEYLSAAVPEVISQKYDEYNRLYQSQYYWAYGFFAVWLASHVDALFFSRTKSAAQLSLAANNQYPTISLIIHFYSDSANSSSNCGFSNRGKSLCIDYL